MKWRIVALITIIPTVALADNHEQFGACEVYSDVDEFTDEVFLHVLKCGRGTVLFGILCFSNPENPMLKNQPIPRFFRREYRMVPNEVLVRIRFDKDRAYIGTWFGINDTDIYSASAASHDLDAALYILNGIASADTIMYEIDGEVSIFDLTTAGGEMAVHAFYERCKKKDIENE